MAVSQWNCLLYVRPLDDDRSNDDDASPDSRRDREWQGGGSDVNASATQSGDEESQDRSNDEDNRMTTQQRAEYTEAKRAKLREIEVRQCLAIIIFILYLLVRFHQSPRDVSEIFSSDI